MPEIRLRAGDSPACRGINSCRNGSICEMPKKVLGFLLSYNLLLPATEYNLLLPVAIVLWAGVVSVGVVFARGGLRRSGLRRRLLCEARVPTKGSPALSYG